MLKVWLFLLCSVMLVNAAFTEEIKEFYESRKEGYYWYHDEKQEPEKKVKKYTYQEIYDMHPDQFKEHFDAVLKQAIHTQSEEDVVEYLKIKDIASRKSISFAAVSSFLQQQHPDIAMSGTAPGRRAEYQLRNKEIDDTIFQNRDKFALVMLVREGCEYCIEQDKITYFFEEKYDWAIRTVDIDENPSFAARFNIDITPTILIVKDDGTHLIVSYGVVSMNDLKMRVYRSIRYMNGEINEKQWFMHDYENKMGGNPLKGITMGVSK